MRGLASPSPGPCSTAGSRSARTVSALPPPGNASCLPPPPTRHVAAAPGSACTPAPPPPPMARRVVAGLAAALVAASSTATPAWSAAQPDAAGPSSIEAAAQTAPKPTPAAPALPWSPSDPPPTALPPLRSFTPPKVETATLPNGLRIFFVPDRGTPTLRGALVMRGGARAAPPTRPALATLAASAQRSGGSVSHPAAALDAALDAMAASIEAGASSDGTSLGFECLAPDARAVLGLLGELVTSPALPPDKVALAKAFAVDALRHKDDAPGAIPGREAAKLIYGRDSVHARPLFTEDVMDSTVGDVRAYLAASQRPDAAVLAVAGDTDMASLVAGVKASPLGAAWRPPPGGPRVPPPLPDSPLADPAAWKGKTFLVDRPGLAQASVVLAEPGVVLTDADTPALDVLSGALNSFGGRLFDGLRARAGLAYTVSAGWDTGRADHVGLFVAGGATAAPAEFLARLTAALEGVAAGGGGGGAGLAPAEVAAAKAQATNGFIFNYASPDALVSRAASLALFDLPPDYLSTTYKAALAAVTPASVSAAASAHLHPRDAVAVVVGDARAVRPALEALGRGPVLDLVPDPPSRAKPKPAAAAAGGSGGGGQAAQNVETQ